MKIITMTALVLALTGGAAFADRHHGGGGGGNWGHESHGGSRSWSGGVSVHTTPRWNGNGGGHWDRGYNGGGHWDRGYNGGGYYHGGYNVVRRPVYVRRPYIRERYFDYRIRPRIIVENYAPMTGYYWVSGQWSWDGYEWNWQAGHYEPDPSYVDPAYTDPYYE